MQIDAGWSLTDTSARLTTLIKNDDIKLYWKEYDKPLKMNAWPDDSIYTQHEVCIPSHPNVWVETGFKASSGRREEMSA